MRLVEIGAMLTVMGAGISIFLMGVVNIVTMYCDYLREGKVRTRDEDYRYDEKCHKANILVATSWTLTALIGAVSIGMFIVLLAIEIFDV